MTVSAGASAPAGHYRIHSLGDCTEITTRGHSWLLKSCGPAPKRNTKLWVDGKWPHSCVSLLRSMSEPGSPRGSLSPEIMCLHFKTNTCYGGMVVQQEMCWEHKGSWHAERVWGLVLQEDTLNPHLIPDMHRRDGPGSWGHKGAAQHPQWAQHLRGSLSAAQNLTKQINREMMDFWIYITVIFLLLNIKKESP